MGTAKRERQKANRQARLEELARESQRRKSRSTALKIGVAVVGLLAIFFVLAFLVGGDDQDDASTTTSVDQSVQSTTTAATETTTPAEPVIVPFEYGTGECAPAEGVDEPVREFTAAPQQCIEDGVAYTATFETSEGTIVVALEADVVPGTVNNFVNLARFGYYDGTKIFRTDPSIDIIQGGGLTNTDSPGYTIPDEGTGFTYQAGDLAMARTAAPNSAGGQWFFVAGPNASLLDGQGTYVNFGTVTEGLDVVQAILALAGPDGQTPTRDVDLVSVTITEG